MTRTEAERIAFEKNGVAKRSPVTGIWYVVSKETGKVIAI